MKSELLTLRELIKKGLNNVIRNVFRGVPLESFIIQEAGSIGRNTNVSLNNEIQDIDFSLRFKRLKDKKKFLVLIEELSKDNNEFINFLRANHVNGLIQGFIDFGNLYPERYKDYIKIDYIISTERLKVNLEINISIWPYKNYVDVFNKQIREITRIGGQRAVKRVLLDIRKMKILLKKSDLYRSNTDIYGIKGVAIEQWIIQSGCYKNKIIKMKSVGSFQKALGWVLKVADYPSNPKNIPDWEEVRRKFCVRRSYGENVKEKGCFFNKIRNEEWKKLIMLALKYKKRFGSVFILIDNKYRILMQLRDSNDKNYPHQWCFPGGNKLSYETYAETAVREGFEEYNINLSKNRYDDIGEYSNKKTIDKSKVFVFFVSDKEKKDIVMKEGESIKWVSIEGIKELKLGHGHSRIIPLIEGYFKEKGLSQPYGF